MAVQQFVTPSSIDGHLRCILPIVENIANNTCVQGWVWTLFAVHLGTYLRRESPGQRMILYVTKKDCEDVIIAPFYNLLYIVWRSNFSITCKVHHIPLSKVRTTQKASSSISK